MTDRDAELLDAIADYGWCYDGEVTFTISMTSMEAARQLHARMGDVLRASEAPAPSSVENRRSSGEDRRRLDFLESQCRTDVGVNLHERLDPPGIGVFCMASETAGSTLREAIDAALGSSRGDRRTDEGAGRRPVHNHGPEDGPSFNCREYRIDGRLAGECVLSELLRGAELQRGSAAPRPPDVAGSIGHSSGERP